MTGRKDDAGKLRYDLIDPYALRQVARVLTWGAEHYGAENWREVANGRGRYTAALMRHIEAFRAGEALDPGTGIPHLAHAVACGLFLLVFTRGDENCHPVPFTVPKMSPEEKAPKTARSGPGEGAECPGPGRGG